VAADPPILVVDDSPAVLTALAALLSSHFTITTERSPLRALELVRAGDFDALCVDMEMPALSGLDLITAVHATHPHLGAIILTGVSEYQCYDARRRINVPVLFKPYDPYELIRSITHIATITRMRRSTASLAKRFGG
jgi:DNA-binding NtrC family response regulator